MDILTQASRLEALGNPTRLAIYRALVRAGHAGAPVGKLQDEIGIPASTLSHSVSLSRRNEKTSCASPLSARHRRF